MPRRTVILFSANAATQFAIQAYLAYGFAAHVWPLPAPLPYAAPVALDIFAITLMGFAFELRNADLRQRIYVWFWLGVVIGAQVAAAEGYAAHEDWTLWGRGASLFPSIFLAASLHALIIAARKRDHVPVPAAGPGRWERWRTGRAVAREIKAERKAAASTPRPVTVTPRAALAAVTVAARALPAPARPPVLPAAPEPTRATPAEQAAGAAPVRARPTRRPDRPTRPAPVGPRGGRKAELYAVAVKRVIDGGETAKAVALDLGEAPRNVQNWANEERALRAGARTVRSREGAASASANAASSDAPVP
jgi:hypothetical protein